MCFLKIRDRLYHPPKQVRKVECCGLHPMTSTVPPNFQLMIMSLTQSESKMTWRSLLREFLEKKCWLKISFYLKLHKFSRFLTFFQSKVSNREIILTNVFSKKLRVITSTQKNDREMSKKCKMLRMLFNKLKMSLLFSRPMINPNL